VLRNIPPSIPPALGRLPCSWVIALRCPLRGPGARLQGLRRGPNGATIVRMLARLCCVFVCLPLAFLGGCGGGSQATSPTDAPTVTGGSSGPARAGGGPGGVGGGGGTGGQLSTATSAAPAACIPGASVACACVTGKTGAQVCNAQGTFGACVCAAPTASPDASAPAACVPGASAACVCPTGQQGTQICTTAGTFAGCACAAPTVDAGSAGGSDGAATSPPDAPAATGGSDARAATGGEGGSDGPTATGGATITDGPMATGGADARDAPVATGGTSTGGAAGGNGTAGTSGSAGATGTGGTSPAPAIISFTASPAAISAGQSSTLGWTVTGATTLSIDQGIGSVLGKTSQVVAPTQTTTYTLTLNGSVSAQMTVALTIAALQGVFARTGSMTVPRVSGSHTATLLSNGKVLIAGGDGINNNSRVILANAELFDPAAGTFAATGSMTVARNQHTATLLPNGQVLIVGGNGINNSSPVTLASAEIYDPIAGTFTATRNMTVARVQHTATLLPNGEVLIAGGNNGDASAELYDYGPSAGTFTAISKMTAARAWHTATLMGNGKVLVAGGLGVGSAELYDPAARTFTATGSMTTVRELHTAILLGNGQVLIAGGNGIIDHNEVAVASAELYDPAAATFTATGSMTTVREMHTATLLGDGTVLIAGGDNNGAGLSFVSLASAELYDTVAGAFAATGSMTLPMAYHTATLLPSGMVLIVGGDPVAELYQ
jgi:Galactose oxidase, central domain